VHRRPDEQTDDDNDDQEDNDHDKHNGHDVHAGHDLPARPHIQATATASPTFGGRSPSCRSMFTGDGYSGLQGQLRASRHFEQRLWSTALPAEGGSTSLARSRAGSVGGVDLLRAARLLDGAAYEDSGEGAPVPGAAVGVARRFRAVRGDGAGIVAGSDSLLRGARPQRGGR
jgi:hypothetical protein